MPTVTPPSPMKCFQYRLVEKLRIVNKVKQTGWVNPIAHQEGTSPSNVRRWMLQEQDIIKSIDMEKRKKTEGVFPYKEGWLSALHAH